MLEAGCAFAFASHTKLASNLISDGGVKKERSSFWSASALVGRLGFDKEDLKDVFEQFCTGSLQRGQGQGLFFFPLFIASDFKKGVQL